MRMTFRIRKSFGLIKPVDQRDFVSRVINNAELIARSKEISTWICQLIYSRLRSDLEEWETVFLFFV